MSKAKQKKNVSKQAEKEISFNIFPTKYETWICLGIIVVSILVLFSGVVFEGKVFVASDNIASLSFNPYLDEANEQGIFPLWIPYVFGGMPSYGPLMTTGIRWWDFSKDIVIYIIKLITTILPNISIVLYYIIFGLAMFAFMYNKIKDKHIALFVSMVAILSTSIFNWIVDGHNTKLVTMAFFPLVLLFIDLLIKKMNLLYVVIIIIALHIMIEATHLQMIFYCYMFMGIYLLYYLIKNFRIKEALNGAIRSIIVLAIATVIVFFLSADRYFSTYEYSKYSIRGSSPLQMSNQPEQQSQTGKDGGLSYDYATNWSFGPEEMITFFVPGFYGSGKIDHKGPLTQNQKQSVNFYIGPMMFTGAPQYMGVIVLMFAFIGVYYYRKDVFVQALIIISVVALLMSFGREFPLVYKLMFDYFPYFDKFRVPVMILILLQISVPILAGYGLAGIISSVKNKTNENLNKKFLYITVSCVALLLITILAKDLVISIYKGFYDSAISNNIDNGLTQYIKSSAPEQATAIFRAISDIMYTDLTISLLLVSAFFTLTLLILKRKINWTIYFFSILILSVIDLYRIDSRTYDPQYKQTQERIFEKPDWVAFLEQDKSLYRIIELEKGQPNTSNIPAYFKLQNIYGYNPAKIRIIQDVIENCDIRNPLVMNLFSTKYLISDILYQDTNLKVVYQGQSSRMNVIENLDALPRAFFVKSYEVKDKITIVSNLRDMNFNPTDIAYLEEDPNMKIDFTTGEEIATVTDFGIHNLSIDVTATGNNLLFISEVYYPAGWKAFIDGVETPIYKTNYLWRSIIVPQGNHKIEMRFEPQSFKTGFTISIVLNILLVGVLIGYAVFYSIKFIKLVRNR
jgi:hypothetical protein